MVAILPSHMEASYCTSRFFRSHACQAISLSVSCLSRMHIGYRVLNQAVMLMCPDRMITPNRKMACFTREGTSTIVVYGKHFFQNNFSWAIMLEMFCCLN